ncbi:MAG: radical SAM protein [Candidatus Omnitrophica bacterium]|nr:radical SAM protein [Candidatus Omnitrophota bacterium]
MSGAQDSIYTQLKNQKEGLSGGSLNPLFCDVLITERCNLKCRKCRFWKNGTENEVSIEEYKDFFVSLKEFDTMPLEVNLGGGEPLLKKGVLDLISFCAELGFKPAIATNATLIDKAMAKRLAMAGLSRLSISLDSLDADVHDFITGTQGSYMRLMKAVKYLKRYWQKGTVHINTVLTHQNAKGLKDLVEWVNNDKFFNGIAVVALAQPFRTESIDKWYLDEEYGLLWPKDPDSLSSIIDIVIAYKRAGYKVLNPISQLEVYKRYYANPGSFARVHNCNFGEYIFNINVIGHVHLCCFMRQIGNIKNGKIKNIWFSEEAKKTRELMKGCQKSCNNIVNCYFQDEG